MTRPAIGAWTRSAALRAPVRATDVITWYFHPYTEVFVSRITRKELKTDKFALEVEHTVTFFEEHQQQIVRIGGIVVAVAVLIAGYAMYSRHQHSKREEALYKAIQVQEAPVGPPVAGANLNFPTQETKDQVAIKAFSDLRSQYPGTAEGEIAQYYLGSIQADQGKLAEAEKSFKDVADHGDARYASLAKLALVQIYYADGREQQGEAMLKDLSDHPTEFVSKDQASLTLARYLLAKKPAEARKILDSLRGKQGAVGQTAMTLYAELPPQ
jgi:predicted negative regulator of RcsB-dependent stress response